VRTVRAANATDREVAEVDVAAVGAWQMGIRVAKISALVVPVAGIAMQVAFLTVLGVGGYRVADGAITVAYDGYGPFNERFGHLFYEVPFADYHLVVEYRFTGPQQEGAPGWALRNSGAMLHAQPPATMMRDQDFPISVELQLLGGLSDGRARTTANMCSPGTEVDVNGAQVRGHCLNSSSKTYDGDQWVTMEAIVRGSTITHIANGDTVLTYTNARVGGGNVAGHDPAAKVDGTPLTGGYIALQSEGHPVAFRRVMIRSLLR
jgi:hypothetical protein